MKLRSAWILFALAASWAPAQGSKPAPAKPITGAQAAQVLLKVETSIYHTLGLPAAKLVSLPAAPLSKADALAQFRRICDECQPKFRTTPRPFRIVPAQLAKISDAKAQENARYLALRGFIGPVGPLVVDPSGTLTPQQFGKALGMLISQIMQLSHQPSPKWTPELQGIGD